MSIKMHEDYFHWTTFPCSTKQRPAESVQCLNTCSVHSYSVLAWFFWSLLRVYSAELSKRNKVLDQRTAAAVCSRGNRFYMGIHFSQWFDLFRRCAEGAIFFIVVYFKNTWWKLLHISIVKEMKPLARAVDMITL